MPEQSWLSLLGSFDKFVRHCQAAGSSLLMMLFRNGHG